MATSSYREDWLGRDLVTPGTTSKDHLGRLTTSTVDSMGRPLRRIVRANDAEVTLNQELQFTGGEKFIVTVAGTLAASAPSAPAVGSTVEDGTATLRRTK